MYTPDGIAYNGATSQEIKYDITFTQPTGKGYHYSNTDISYDCKNGDGSTYHNTGAGDATYTAPNGNAYKKQG